MGGGGATVWGLLNCKSCRILNSSYASIVNYSQLCSKLNWFTD